MQRGNLDDLRALVAVARERTLARWKRCAWGLGVMTAS